MSKGRPPNWNVFGSLDAGTWTEVIGITSKERLSLPVAIRKRLSWLEAAAVDGLLAILDPRGSAELIAWNDLGEKTVARVAKRWTAAAGEDRSQLALAAMDRYLRISVEPPGRVGLPSNLAAHVDPDQRVAVRVVVSNERLWLWSEAAWQASRADRIAILAEC